MATPRRSVVTRVDARVSRSGAPGGSLGRIRQRSGMGCPAKEVFRATEDQHLPDERVRLLTDDINRRSADATAARLVPLADVPRRALMPRRGKLDRIRSAVDQAGTGCLAEWRMG